MDTEKVAVVFRELLAHLREGGSFKHLIYKRLEVPLEKGNYRILYLAGGMILSNALDLLAECGFMENFTVICPQCGQEIDGAGPD